MTGERGQNAERFALYFSPSPDSTLGRFGADWLGRSTQSGEDLGAPDSLPDGLAENWRTWTASPRFYGFHGTLKPPFALSAGTDEGDLLNALESFCVDQSAFAIPQLTVKPIGRFIALVPDQPCPPLNAFAAACVSAFDGFRAPQSEADLVKRRAKGLTERQESMLQKWGYPYVMEEFRFHLTLTGPLDKSEQDKVMEILKPLAADVAAQAVQVDCLALFHQPDRVTPFTERQRFALKGR